MTNAAVISVAIFAAVLVLFALAVAVGKWLKARHERSRWWWV